MTKKAMVFGSFVVDLMSRAPHLPVPGETVKGSMFKMGPGGKGFNQAVACFKTGCDCIVSTKIGRDALGKIATDVLAELKIDDSHIFYSDSVETGTAIIAVDEVTSQNQIVVVPGACNHVDDENIAILAESLKECDYLLTQLETNLDAVYKLIDIAEKLNVKVLLNPAPAQKVDESIYQKLFIVTPNETEAESLTGIKVTDYESAGRAAREFMKKGVKNVVITMGEKGVYLLLEGEEHIVEALRVDVVDTTGAGDAFSGGLVAGLSKGMEIPDAVRYANVVAALSVQKLGTTPAMPTKDEIDTAFAKIYGGQND